MTISPIEKALSIRSNWLRKARRPHNAASQRLKDSLALWGLLEKSHPSKKGELQEARRNVVIALVASFEIYWRETFRSLIDRERVPSERFRSLDRISFSLEDAGTIIGRKLTLGELVACSQTFQSIESVNRLASSLLGTDFFRSFRDVEFLVAAADPKERLKPVTFRGEDIFKHHVPHVVKCLRLRHALAHDWPSRVKLSRSEVGTFYGSISTWNLLLGASLQWQMLDGNGNTRRNSLPRARGPIEVGGNHMLVPKSDRAPRPVRGSAVLSRRLAGARQSTKHG